MLQSVDSTAVAAAIDRATQTLAQQAAPSWERWTGMGLQSLLAVLTLLAVLYAARSARSAQASARAAREASDFVFLRELLGHFDARGYLVRFWRLGREAYSNREKCGFWSLDVVELRNDSVRSGLWDDALGATKRTIAMTCSPSTTSCCSSTRG